MNEFHTHCITEWNKPDMEETYESTQMKRAMEDSVDDDKWG